ncbi:MAG: hypothetical protein V4472_12390 [Pseudomonadota bacterium]
MRIIGLWCRAFGHRTASGSKRVFEGNVFATCRRCSCELFRDPKNGVWRAATHDDRRARRLVLSGDGVATSDIARKSRRKSSRSRKK